MPTHHSLCKPVRQELSTRAKEAGLRISNATSGVRLLRFGLSGAIAAGLIPVGLWMAAQLPLAWLLRRSPNILLIPGTSSVVHLRENLAAAHLELSNEMLERLDRIGQAVPA